MLGEVASRHIIMVLVTFVPIRTDEPLVAPVLLNTFQDVGPPHIVCVLDALV